MIGAIPVFLIDTADTSPQVLPDGRFLRFQSARSDPSMVRAVVVSGSTVFATGKLVDKRYAFASRWDALAQVGFWVPQPQDL